MTHYSKEELELYRHREMSVLGRIACTAHLKNCPECAARLAELEKDDALVVELRRSIRLFSSLNNGGKKRSRTLRRKQNHPSSVK